MYEDNEQPILRRVLLIIVWLVIIITIAWAVIWLAFFRHDNQTNQTGLKNGTSQHTQKSSGQSKAQTSNGSSVGSSSQQGTTSTPSTSSAQQQPQALANTGAGDVFIPFIGASIIGTTAYYIRLRKKLVQ